MHNKREVNYYLHYTVPGIFRSLSRQDAFTALDPRMPIFRLLYFDSLFTQHRLSSF